MSKPLHKTTPHKWGKYAAYIICAFIGGVGGHYSGLINGTRYEILPDFPGPIAPGAIMLLTTQLYGMLFLLILLILSRKFFPTAAPFITAITIGFFINTVFEGAFGAFIHLHQGVFYSPL